MAQVGRLSAFAGSIWMACAGLQSAIELASMDSAVALVVALTSTALSRPDVDGLRSLWAAT